MPRERCPAPAGERRLLLELGQHLFGLLPIPQPHQGLDQVSLEAQDARLTHLQPAAHTLQLFEVLAGGRPLLVAEGKQSADGQHIHIDGCGFKAFGEVPRLVEVCPTLVVPAGCGLEAGHARQAVGFSVVGTGLAREAD